MNSNNPHKNLLGILFLLGLFFLLGPTAAAISGAKGLASAEEAIRAENLIEKIHELASPAYDIFSASLDSPEITRLTDSPGYDAEGVVSPDGKKIVFTSLYRINTDGTGLERITYDAGFDSFPMFSKDGNKIVFASTRNGKSPREFNIFIADWVP